MEERRVYDLSSKKEIAQEVIGSQAYKYVELINKNILVPQAFVVTTEAFDEFIQLNGLVDFIIDALSEVARNPKKIEKYSKLIEKEILKAEIDSNLNSTIAGMYKRFSGFGKTSVRVQASIASDELAGSIPSHLQVIENVFGVEGIVDSIKLVWASLFSAAAMEYREDIQYEGPLTMAVMISKEPVAEVSGIAHCIMPLHDQNEMEIEAILGGIKPLLSGDLNGDRYICNLITDEVVEKNIIEQKWMLVNKFEKGSFTKRKIEISDVWKHRAKLSENQIAKIITIAKTVIEKYQRPIDIYLGIELGKVIITDIKIVEDHREMISERKGGSHFEELRAKLEAEPDVTLEQPIEPIQIIDQKVKKSMDDYVDEFKEMMSAEVKLQSDEEKGDDDYEDYEDVADDISDGVPDDTAKAEAEPKLKTESESKKLVQPEIENIKIAEQVKTITEVYATNYDKPAYIKNSLNIDGLLGVKSADFTKSVEKSELIKEISHAIQDVNQPVILDLSNSELYETELDVIKSLRNKAGLRNLWVCLTNIRTEEEFVAKKKQIYLANLRRSSTFKVYAKIDNPASIMLVKDLIETGVDGLIFDIDSIALSIFGGENIAIKILLEYLKIGMKQAAGSMLPVIVSGRLINLSSADEKESKNSSANSDLALSLKELLKLGATGITVNTNMATDAKKYIAGIEVGKLKKL